MRPKKLLSALIAAFSLGITGCNTAVTPTTPSYTVTFNSNGGSVVESQTVKQNNKVTKPEDPTKNGYTFDNWTYQGEEWSFTEDKVTGNMTLDANWNINQYTNTYVDGFGNVIATITKDYGSQVTPPTVDGRYDSEGAYCTFSGWDKNGYDTIGSSDATYTATWSSKITYIFNGNTLIGVMDKTITAAIIPSKTPTGETVMAIGGGAFYNCTSLSSVIIPNTVTSIGDGAFYGCSSLSSINIPDSVNSIGTYAFGGTSLKYNSYDNADYLGNSNNPYLALVKAKDTSVTSCEINSNCKIICDSAFDGCSKLSSVTIPDSVIYMGYVVFTSCSSLSSIVVDSNNKVYDSRNNCNAVIETSTNTLIEGCKNTIIPDTVTSIGSHAFRKRSSLSSIIIPNSVTSIGDDAFYNCTSLSSITIPDSITSIGQSAFQNCSSLSSINIPNNLISISNNAFCGCSSLLSVTIPDTVTSIGDSAFWGCSSLSSIIIPDSVTSIGSDAFYGCYKLMIYCEASSQPSGWDSDWNPDNRPIVWDYSKS